MDKHNQIQYRKEVIHMKALYIKDSIIGKIEEKFIPYFAEQTRPTARHLFELMLSMIALNGYQSVRFNYQHFLSGFSG